MNSGCLAGRNEVPKEFVRRGTEFFGKCSSPRPREPKPSYNGGTRMSPTRLVLRHSRGYMKGEKEQHQGFVSTKLTEIQDILV